LAYAGEIGGGSNGTPLEEAHWQNMDDNCYKAILAQIQRELNASLTYLAMVGLMLLLQTFNWEEWFESQFVCVS